MLADWVTHISQNALHKLRSRDCGQKIRNETKVRIVSSKFIGIMGVTVVCTHAHTTVQTRCANACCNFYYSGVYIRITGWRLS